MEHELFVCACGDIAHQIILTKYDDEPERYMHVGLRRDYPWWKRLWVALKYIFGTSTCAYHFEVILSDADCQKLAKALTK